MLVVVDGQLIYNKCMGCGSSVAQVSDSIKEGLFKPVRLLEMEREGDAVETEGRVFLFGETRTQRKILQLQLVAGCMRVVSSRVRIPVPRITYDPIELMYEESQEIFHLGVYGLSVQPPFNRMLALFLQHNLIFLCGGRDFDGYNIKNDTFYYSITDDAKEGPTELTARIEARPKYSANKFQKVASMISRRYGHMGIYIQKLKGVLVFGGINDKEEIVNSCERYGVLDNVWKELGGMNTARAYGSCFHFGNKVYVFGGRSGMNKKSKKIEAFDLETHQWEVLPFKIHRGIEDALIASQTPNEIMIIGGKTHSGPTKSVIKVDILNQSYVWDSNLNNEYQSVKGMRTRSEILVFGGSKNAMQVYANGQWTAKNLDHKKYVEQEEMEIFSFTTQSTHVGSRKSDGQQAKMTKEDLILFGNDEYPCLLVRDAREGSARKCSVSMKFKMHSKMAIAQYEKGRYFLAGGCDWKERKSYSSCFFYNADTQETQETVKMSEKKHNFGICTLDGFIYVFGGYDSTDKTTKKSCAKFSLVNEGWDLLPTMRRARNRCHSLAINSNKIAVFGGVNANEPVLGIEIFNILQRKFDIYEPTLQLPYGILCSYNLPNNQHNIFILNKGADYQLITVCLGANPHNTSLSTISNNVEAAELGEHGRKQEGSSSQVNSDLSSYDPIVVYVHPEESENIIRVKPKLVQILPKKLESDSSQMNLSHNKEEAFDMDSSFHIEKIDLRKKQTGKIVTEVVSEAEGNSEEKKQHISNFVIEHERPIQLGNTELNTQYLSVKVEHNQVLPTQSNQIPVHKPQAKQEQVKIQEQFKLISSKPVDWLSKNEAYLVTPRLDHIYFLTNNCCIQLNKATGEVLPIEFRNGTKVPIDMIK